MMEQHLDVLHNHYTESFAYIREWEKQRDRLFLVLIGLFALLFFEVQYPFLLLAYIATSRLASPCG